MSGNILVFGETGQVAQALAATGRVSCVGRGVADLADPGACAALIAARRPIAVINAAAYTAVDRAETEEQLAGIVNGAAPGAMAQACAMRDIPFVHISTDYVFAGTGSAPWRAEDPCEPRNAYGRSKLAGEVAVQAAGGRSAVLRTSWVVSAHGSNFVKTMLRLGQERQELSIVADQIGAPTSARAIAAACLQIVERLAADASVAGTYHFQGQPEASWADFAREIFRQAQLPCRVIDIPSSAYPTPAVRPLNSRMDCTSTREIFGIGQPDWHADLRDILNTLKGAA